jgi:hypothetical protein
MTNNGPYYEPQGPKTAPSMDPLLYPQGPKTAPSMDPLLYPQGPITAPSMDPLLYPQRGVGMPQQGTGLDAIASGIRTEGQNTLNMRNQGFMNEVVYGQGMNKINEATFDVTEAKLTQMNQQQGVRNEIANHQQIIQEAQKRQLEHLASQHQTLLEKKK